MERAMTGFSDEALAIWRAGVDAVDSRRLVGQSVRVDGDELCVADERISLSGVQRIVVVGAGKAGAGMAAGLEEVLGPILADRHQLSGWVNVPDDCVRPLDYIHLHGARRAGSNEPSEAGLVGAREILNRVSGLTPKDLCICLISGGASALLPAPIPGITLAQKLQLTRFLAAAGANIQQLNIVRRPLSVIKGGGLARACRAGRLISLIISDVIGDPLDVIGSGPTMVDHAPAKDAAMAVQLLNELKAREAGIDEQIFEVLGRVANWSGTHAFSCTVTNTIIGNNETAVQAARRYALSIGYETTVLPSEAPTSMAEEVGQDLVRRMAALRSRSSRLCLIQGGEPVVRLNTPGAAGLGGRNQQLVLAAVQTAMKRAWMTGSTPLKNQVIVSGGTDGEDGPTDAAGALADEAVIARAQELKLDPADYLRRNDAYHFFDATGGLIRTGPTHTNVCDLRVMLEQTSTAGR